MDEGGSTKDEGETAGDALQLVAAAARRALDRARSDMSAVAKGTAKAFATIATSTTNATSLPPALHLPPALAAFVCAQSGLPEGHLALLAVQRGVPVQRSAASVAKQQQLADAHLASLCAFLGQTPPDPSSPTTRSLLTTMMTVTTTSPSTPSPLPSASLCLPLHRLALADLPAFLVPRRASKDRSNGDRWKVDVEVVYGCEGGERDDGRACGWTDKVTLRGLGGSVDCFPCRPLDLGADAPARPGTTYHMTEVRVTFAPTAACPSPPRLVLPRATLLSRLHDVRPSSTVRSSVCGPADGDRATCPLWLTVCGDTEQDGSVSLHHVPSPKLSLSCALFSPLSTSLALHSTIPLDDLAMETQDKSDTSSSSLVLPVPLRLAPNDDVLLTVSLSLHRPAADARASLRLGLATTVQSPPSSSTSPFPLAVGASTWQTEGEKGTEQRGEVMTWQSGGQTVVQVKVWLVCGWSGVDERGGGATRIPLDIHLTVRQPVQLQLALSPHSGHPSLVKGKVTLTTPACSGKTEVLSVQGAPDEDGADAAELSLRPTLPLSLSPGLPACLAVYNGRYVPRRLSLALRVRQADGRWTEVQWLLLVPRCASLATSTRSPALPLPTATLTLLQSTTQPAQPSFTTPPSLATAAGSLTTGTPLRLLLCLRVPVSGRRSVIVRYALRVDERVWIAPGYRTRTLYIRGGKAQPEAGDVHEVEPTVVRLPLQLVPVRPGVHTLPTPQVAVIEVDEGQDGDDDDDGSGRGWVVVSTNVSPPTVVVRPPTQFSATA